MERAVFRWKGLGGGERGWWRWAGLQAPGTNGVGGRSPPCLQRFPGGLGKCGTGSEDEVCGTRCGPGPGAQRGQDITPPRSPDGGGGTSPAWLREDREQTQTRRPSDASSCAGHHACFPPVPTKGCVSPWLGRCHSFLSKARSRLPGPTEGQPGRGGAPWDEGGGRHHPQSCHHHRHRHRGGRRELGGAQR